MRLYCGTNHSSASPPPIPNPKSPTIKYAKPKSCIPTPTPQPSNLPDQYPSNQPKRAETVRSPPNSYDNARSSTRSGRMDGAGLSLISSYNPASINYYGEGDWILSYIIYAIEIIIKRHSPPLYVGYVQPCTTTVMMKDGKARILVAGGGTQC